MRNFAGTNCFQIKYFRLCVFRFLVHTSISTWMSCRPSNKSMTKKKWQKKNRNHFELEKATQEYEKLCLCVVSKLHSCVNCHRHMLCGSLPVLPVFLFSFSPHTWQSWLSNENACKTIFKCAQCQRQMKATTTSTHSHTFINSWNSKNTAPTVVSTPFINSIYLAIRCLSLIEMTFVSHQDLNWISCTENVIEYHSHSIPLVSTSWFPFCIHLDTLKMKFLSHSIFTIFN